MEQAKVPGLKIPLDQLPLMTCRCGSDVFFEVMQLRYASAFVSPEGVPTTVRVRAGWRCLGCGGLNDYQEHYDSTKHLPIISVIPPEEKGEEDGKRTH